MCLLCAIYSQIQIQFMQLGADKASARQTEKAGHPEEGDG